ncbi:MauE/DoxX family redox-associated membrane protein [Desulforhabdus sp. TSK]|uniref:MauE/DoxX family redox-associated membrane protein n=1 Tax=Desulforhabdus sp. TSK TaxID=2925014 RepID=UPI001FC8169C|nr:MauE/DoxX family redox-associated membrane protein [Desulforhabdus sp. TSK]GKT10974.1 hypothetical protein DSTSK_42790 [Desulforhabdus sp. TSK]
MSPLKRVLFYSPWLYRASRIFLGCIFIWAGGAKLIRPRTFARTISGWDLLPYDMLIPVAIGLPAIELLAGLGLVFSIRGSLSVITGLLLAFLVLLGRGILDNLNIDCGCFSPDDLHSQKSLMIAFYRDLGLMGIVSYLFMWRWFQRRSGMECEIRT